MYRATTTAISGCTLDECLQIWFAALTGALRPLQGHHLSLRTIIYISVHCRKCGILANNGLLGLWRSHVSLTPIPVSLRICGVIPDDSMLWPSGLAVAQALILP